MLLQGNAQVSLVAVLEWQLIQQALLFWEETRYHANRKYQI